MQKQQFHQLQCALMLLSLLLLTSGSAAEAADNSAAPKVEPDVSLNAADVGHGSDSTASTKSDSSMATTVEDSSTVEQPLATESAIEIDKTKSIEELVQLGDEAGRAGEFTKAEQLYKAADGKVSGFDRDTRKVFDVIEKLASLYNKQDRLEEALRELDRANQVIQSLPSDDTTGDVKLKTQFRITKTCFKAGLPKRALLEARSTWSMCESSGTSDPLLQSQILTMLGMAQVSNGLVAEATTSLDQALTIVAPLCPAIAPSNPKAPAAPPPVLTEEQKKAIVCKAEILAYKSKLQRRTHNVEDSDSDKLSEESMRLFKLAGAPKNNLTYFGLELNNRFASKPALTEETVNQILDKTVKEYGENSLETCFVLDRVAEYLFCHNKFDKSIAALNRALKILDKLVPSNSIEVSRQWGTLGFNHVRLGDRARAASEFKKAYDIDLSAAGEGSPDLANSAEQLSMAYMTSGQYKEAENLTLQAWKINERLYGRKSSKVLQNLANLGALYSLQGRYKEAIQYTYWAYVATRQMYGEDSQKLSTTAGNLGVFYMRSGNLKEAQTLFAKELALEAKRGMHRPEYADALSRRANLFICQGKVAEATDWFGKAFKIKEKAYGLTHRETYEAMSTYYELLRRLGRTAEANSLQSRYKIALVKARKPG